MKFQVYLHKKVHYPKANRKKYRSYFSNNEQFLRQFQVIQLFEIFKKSSESRGKIGTRLKPRL